MYRATLDAADDFEGWRDAARRFALADVPADAILWDVGLADDLFASDHASPPVTASAPGAGILAVPRDFLNLAETAILHRDTERFALLYTLLLRLHRREARIDDRTDPLVARIEAMAKSVRRDIHKMRAFLRFREVMVAKDGDSGPDNGRQDGGRFVAWFEPDHHIVRANAGFFARRFTHMAWSILTPEVSVHWDGAMLIEGPGAARGDAPDSDPTEALWKSYYASIFNPARLKIGAMLKEMPKKYWRNMPEAALVPELIAGAQAREAAMIARGAARPDGAAAEPAPARRADVAGPVFDGDVAAAWRTLKDEAMRCTRCPLHACASRTVFGEGPLDASLMFVGEQPGDQEDLAGRPFVGPAGQLFDQALDRAGVDRSRAYVTNAVKHFKYELRGKRRIHQTPLTPEIQACRWWLDQERALLRPKIIVALGATAARALTGRAVTIARARGGPIALVDGAEAWVTVHPSYLLRIPDEARQAEERARFVEALRTIGQRVGVLA